VNHGSLFSGIGGFDLAAEWMGWENIFHCEWNEFGKRILKYYWPEAISYDDITTTDFNIHRGRIDILTGGFPCQPYSHAGKRLGKEDDRHLWPEMLRAIREIKPRWVVGENVYGIVNWNGGMVFDEVQADLENEGYEVQPYILPACSVNAPHKRERVWFVAYSVNSGYSEQSRKTREKKSLSRECRKEGHTRMFNGTIGNVGFVTHTDNTRTDNTMRNNRNGAKENKGRKEQPQFKYWENCVNGNVTNTNGELSQKGSSKNRSIKTERHFSASFCKNTWENFPTQTPICNGDDGLSDKLDAITFSKWRNESIKGGGNALVPQAALQIFKAIEGYEKLNL